jgi:penicillin amidase
MELCLLTNNQPEPVDGFSSGYYLPEDRAKRITQLEPKSNWDKAAVGQMIYDNTSSVAPEVVKQLISNLSNKHYPVRKKLLLF